MPKDNRSDEIRGSQLEPGNQTQPLSPAYTRPVQPLSPDDIETGEVPGTLGDPTIAMERVPSNRGYMGDL